MVSIDKPHWLRNLETWELGCASKILNWPFKNFELQSDKGSVSTFDPASIIFCFMVGLKAEELDRVDVNII